VNVVVLAMGTTGTLMGTTRALRELNPAIRVVGVEPFKQHKIQGLKNMQESYPPGISSRRSSTQLLMWMTIRHIKQPDALRGKKGSLLG